MVETRDNQQSIRVTSISRAHRMLRSNSGFHGS